MLLLKNTQENDDEKAGVFWFYRHAKAEHLISVCFSGHAGKSSLTIEMFHQDIYS